MTPRPAVLLAGGAALAGLLALTLGSAAAVATMADGAGRLTAADWRAAQFTVTQAALSALLSVAGAVPVARALARRRFAGRDALARVMGAPFLLPSIVAIIGVTAVWGRSGWVSDGLAAAGLPRLDIYGMPGVLIAHVFFNLPLAARLILHAYEAVPAERWRAAAQLGLEGRALFAVMERPLLARALPGAAAVIFAVCAASFAVALALGGGPRATTLELAIYEAAAFEFDLGRAARLAALQFALCAVAAAVALAAAGPLASRPGLAPPRRWDGRGRAARWGDGAALAAAVGFLGLPMLAVVAGGLPGLGALGPSFWAAAARSLAVALVSTALALAFALPVAALAAALPPRGGALAQAAALTPIAASPFVIGLALFVLLRPVADPSALALPLTALVNAAMAAPYAVTALTPPLRQALAEQGRLADSLGLRGWTRIQSVYLGRIRGPLGFSAGLAAALSAGDLGVIALFSAPQSPTLPLLAYQLAGGRQLDAAQAAALGLVVLSFGLFWIFDRAGRR